VDGFSSALINLPKGRSRRYHPRFTLRLSVLFITITHILTGHPHLLAQKLTTEEPPQVHIHNSLDSLPEAPTPQTASDHVQNTPEDLRHIPRATPLPPDQAPDHAIIMSDNPQSKHGNVYTASGDVVLTYRTYIVHADSVTYDAASGDVIAEGHLRLSGGDNGEYIEASRGTFNLLDQTGHFYNVSGSVGMHNRGGSSTGYVTPNPFLFTGRLVVKTGPENYEIYDGSVTSCLLPNPDWEFTASHIGLNDKKAHASSSIFKLLGVPVLFLPYVTHPTDANDRQTGFLIPVLGFSNSTRGGSKGTTIGEQVYVTLGRSADLTAGFEFYTLRGWSESATARYRGFGSDFASAHFSALQDRGYTDTVTGLYVNQGGEDVTASFRRHLTDNTRVVGDGEYLSSYVYREAFTENFNQAVSSDITSIAYITRQNDGYSLDARFDRYQGLKRVATETEPGQQVHILHVPSIDFTAVDHPIAGTPLLWSLTASAAGLKRIQPNFVTSGIIERFDLRPELSLPLSGGGWHTMTSVAVRETAYTRSRETPYPPGSPPIELTEPINRADFDLKIDIRPPAIERDFAVPESLQKFFGTEIRHTVEPEIVYRNTHGINNFLAILRFDDNDLASNTDELEYGVTQHLYFRPRPRPAKAPANLPPACQTTTQPSDATEAALAETDAQMGRPPDALNPSPADSTDANGIASVSATAPDEPTRTNPRRPSNCPPTVRYYPPQQEWFSWRLTQRYFFEPTFGNAVLDGRRNIFDTTLSLSGIAFLTEPRNISPLISRMRFRTSSHTDVEWDFDYDTGAKKFTSSNVFLDAHEGPVFGGFSFARLNAPGRFYTEDIDTGELVSSTVSDFSQMRVLLGYGTPTRPGFSVATNAGIDLKEGTVQYAAIQGSYNWNCCGLSVEYRKYELGTVRDENAYRFNFTLANIGTAGNIRRAERLF
jgi:LPS-assembly protein